MIGLIKGTMRNVKSVPGLPAPIASFKTNVGGYPLEVVSSVEAVQSGSGDPYPAGGGKNKLNPSLLLDQAGWNTITFNLSPDTQYTMSTNRPSDKVSELPLYFFSSSGTPGSGTSVYAGHDITITTNSDGIAKIQQRRVSGTDSFQNYQWQLEQSSSATSYAPYANIRPIIGKTEDTLHRVGKNLFVNTNPILGAYLNTSASEISYAGWNVSDFIPIKGGETYHFNPNSTLGSDAKGFFYTDNVYSAVIVGSMFNSGEVTITTPNEARYVRFSYRDTSTDIQLEIGSQATAYVAPIGTIYTLQFGSTLYGAKINWKTGVATMIREYKKISNVDSVGTSGGYYFFRKGISPAGVNTPAGYLICNVLKKDASHSPGTCLITSLGTSFHITLEDQTIDTTAKMNTWLSNNDLYICYELATSFDIQLTQTVITQLKKQNNIWCDCGNIDSVKYSNRQIYYGR